MLDGKIAVITAAGSGIGRAGALAMAREGAFVVVTDLDGAAAEATKGAIIDAGGKAKAWRLDVSDDEAIESLIADVADDLGRIDILHNHAGVQVSGSIEQATASEFDRSWDINVHAQFVGCKAVTPS